jgi:hypothetical protein
MWLMRSTSKDGMRICGGEIDARPRKTQVLEEIVSNQIDAGASLAALQGESVVAAVTGTRLLDECVDERWIESGEK